MSFRHAAVFALFAAAASVHAVPTVVTVRAVSRDAKVLGDQVGGARITITDLESGKVLATGLQTGGTGDTNRIMKEPRTRGAVVYATEGTAAFRTTLDLTKPTRVEITAEGPLKYPQAMQRASRTMLLQPGLNLEGDGVLLEIPGFIVDAPPVLGAVDNPVPVVAKVTMSCGCPTEPGGLWNADDIKVVARVLRNGTRVTEFLLSYAGAQSTYRGTAPPLAAGRYDVEIVASDAKTGNVGRHVVPLAVR